MSGLPTHLDLGPHRWTIHTDDLDPAHYSPRCVSCHKRYDLNRSDAHATT